MVELQCEASGCLSEAELAKVNEEDGREELLRRVVGGTLKLFPKDTLADFCRRF